MGALILPWVHHGELNGGLFPVHSAIVPSVSVNRLATNGDPAAEIDSLIYRLGLCGDWRLFGKGPFGFQARGAGLYVTNTAQEAGLWGYELELEPRWQSKSFPLGYSKPLIKKAPQLDDRSDTSVLEYQLRAWVQLEGGDLQEAGSCGCRRPNRS